MIRTRGHKFLLAGPRVLSKVIAVGLWFRDNRNSHVVKDERVDRSAPLEQPKLVREDRRYPIRSMLNLRGWQTADAFMADFAAVMGGALIKTGTACRGERIAKYDRLMEIEAELGGAARFGHAPERGVS